MKGAIIGLVLSIFGGAFGQLFMKTGVMKLNGIEVLEFPSLLLSSPFLFSGVFIGIFLYCCSVFSWSLALRHFELNFAHPLLALGYVVVYVGAVYWPGIEETFTMEKTLGVSLIIFGVVLTTMKDNIRAAI